jgi:hypothetical protein
MFTKYTILLAGRAGAVERRVLLMRAQGFDQVAAEDDAPPAVPY